jgi:hypothetical protein
MASRSGHSRFIDILFHDHSHPHHEHHKPDEDLPGYKDSAAASIMAEVKAGISKAAPFAFLNYILLLTILYAPRCFVFLPPAKPLFDTF